MNSPIIFFSVGWMKRYAGIADDDRPEGGGKWVQEHGWDAAMLNFLPFEGRCYGYGKTGTHQVNLDRLGAQPEADRLECVTVVWVSKAPLDGSVMVGWYQNATLFRHYQEPPEASGRLYQGKSIGYYAIAKAEDCELLPEEARKFPIPHGKGGMGQSNVWYADKPEHEQFKQKVMEYIESGGRAAPPNPPRTWIFQANPKLYDIDTAVTKLSETTWLISSHKDLIAPGDEVFLWRSGDDAGIVAEATVLTSPSVLDPGEEQLRYAIDPKKFSSPELRVRLEIERVFAPPLSRDVLKADSRLTDLSILKFSQGTNFPVTPEQSAVIWELLERRQDDEDEVLGGTSAAKAERESPVWAYAPGPNAQFWEEFYREGIMAIGWDELGDLRQYPDLDSVAQKLIEVYKLQKHPVNSSRACFDFGHAMKPGDRIIVKRGRDEVVGYGIVAGNYEYRQERPEYQHVRQVRWERRGNWKCKPLFPVKTLTEFTAYPDTVRYLTDLIGVSEAQVPVAPTPALPRYTVEDALQGVAFARADFEAILDIWRAKKNIILQGPPGTGKTFLARRLAYTLIGQELPSRVGAVQFHQSYSYEDFIQGYRPSERAFARKDGIFFRFCQLASLDQDSTYVFIIDEINRGNLSKILGELLTLIEADKRGSRNSIALTYSNSEEEQFYVPQNVYVLGMMNTADRSLAFVDYALRRRFGFVELKPLFGSSEFNEFLVKRGSTPNLVAASSARLQALNQAIAEDPNLGPGFMIGHSYFCGNAIPLTEKDYLNAIRHEVIPLLKEYWFDDHERTKQWAEKLELPFD